MRKFAFTLDLKNDKKLIAEYEEWHKRVWPGVTFSLMASGIINMEIYRVSTRLFMMLEVDSSFSFEKKAETERLNSKYQEWEKLMSTYQKSLSFAKPGEKWVLMDKVFDLVNGT